MSVNADLNAARTVLNDAAWNIKWHEGRAMEYRIVHAAMLAKIRECEAALAEPDRVKPDLADKISGDIDAAWDAHRDEAIHKEQRKHG